MKKIMEIILDFLLGTKCPHCQARMLEFFPMNSYLRGEWFCNWCLTTGTTMIPSGKLVILTESKINTSIMHGLKR